MRVFLTGKVIVLGVLSAVVSITALQQEASAATRSIHLKRASACTQLAHGKNARIVKKSVACRGRNKLSSNSLGQVNFSAWIFPNFVLLNIARDAQGNFTISQTELGTGVGEVGLSSVTKLQNFPSPDGQKVYFMIEGYYPAVADLNTQNIRMSDNYLLTPLGFNSDNSASLKWSSSSNTIYMAIAVPIPGDPNGRCRASLVAIDPATLLIKDVLVRDGLQSFSVDDVGVHASYYLNNELLSLDYQHIS